MDLRQKKLWTCLLLVAPLAGCGTPGAPLPPSLEIPRPVTDLHASRKGDEVRLTWSTPVETTERQNLRRGGTTNICRSIAPVVKTCALPLAQIAFKPLPRDASAQQRLASYVDQLPANSQVPATASYVYAVTVLNPYGRSAGLSNEVLISAAPTLPAPGDFGAELSADGIRLSWRAVAAPRVPDLQFVYHVYRRDQANAKTVLVGELPVEGQPTPSLLDRSFEWENTYDYYADVVTVVTSGNAPQQQVEGADTAAVRVVAQDIYPPATPVGLQAAFSGPGQKPFIDLVWSPNTETDLAGYNVYRQEGTGEWVKINSDLVKAPAFRDTNVIPGQEYSYSVSAIDLRGNESPRSAEAHESVPEQ